MQKLLYGFLIAVLLISGSAFAQTDLPQTYTSIDGKLTFNYPAKWVLEPEANSQIFIKSSAAVDTSQETFASGQGAIGFLLPEGLALLNLTPTATPTEALNAFLALVADEGSVISPVTEPEIGNHPAARAEGTSVESDNVIMAIAFETGTVLMILQTAPGELAQFSAIFDAVAATVNYGETAAEGEIVRQWASSAVASSQYGDPSWGAVQATGAPDTELCGDITTAWASASSTGVDSLQLTYAEAVIPSEIAIYQTYNPGSIIRVELTTPDNEVITVPDSADPVGNTKCPGVFRLDVSAITIPVISVTLHLDQTIGGSWNEIDAVELVGTLPGAENTAAATPAATNIPSGTLTETASFNDEYTVMHPTGWLTDSDSSTLYLASSAPAMEALMALQPMPAGEYGLGFLAPSGVISQLDLEATSDPLAVVQGISDLAESTGKVQAYNSLNAPAAISTVTGSSFAPDDYVIIALALPEGTIGVMLGVGGEYTDFEPLIIEILDSLTITTN